MATEPATWGLRRRILDALDRAHLGQPAVRAYELALAFASHLRGRTRADDGLPLPPARLRAQVGPRHANSEFFLRSGREQAEIVRTLVHEDGSAVEDLDALLDWGCGCGRVLRNWSHLPPRTQVAGCDINRKMVEWCAENLPFAEVAVNDLAPPLPYPDASFDLVYAFSVMTHLDEELQHAWSRECYRVLKPHGYFLFSTMGDHYLELGRLNEAERRKFESGDVVVLYEGAPGTSLCSAYHPPDYVREKLAAQFDFVSFRPAIDYGRHDVHLFRRP